MAELSFKLHSVKNPPRRSGYYFVILFNQNGEAVWISSLQYYVGKGWNCGEYSESHKMDLIREERERGIKYYWAHTPMKGDIREGRG